MSFVYILDKSITSNKLCHTTPSPLQNVIFCSVQHHLSASSSAPEIEKPRRGRGLLGDGCVGTSVGGEAVVRIRSVVAVTTY